MSDAVISACGAYRYRLSRGFEPRLPFVMLNPSTADATVDDPTIRRCAGFALREAYTGIEVVNLYAFRATNPRALLTAADPIGPENRAYLAQVSALHSLIVCAWGAHAPPEYAREVAAILRGNGARLVCLGTTKAGAPRHPLYVRGDQPLEDFRP